jgi:aspartate aminotransferase
MKIELSTRLNGVAESATIKMAAAARALAAKGVKVVSFSVGEPDYAPPAPACKAAIDAIHAGFHKYTPVPGIQELRVRLSKKFKDENGLDYPPERIDVTLGAKQAIFNFLLAVVSPGDEVIVPSPYWVSYPEMVKLAGGTPVIIQTTEEDGFKLTGPALKKALTRRTRALLLNSPCNPTGAVYSRAELASLASALEGTNAIVCSDEIYERLLFEGEFTSFAAVSADAYQRTVTVNGFSKTFAMTGWRLAYAAGPKPIIDAMILLQGQSTSGANSIAQKMALAALDTPDAEIEKTIQTLKSRRDQMMRLFSESPLLSFIESPGTFYLFVNVEKVLGKKTPSGAVLDGSDALALYLLEDGHAAVVPGAGFGREGYVRLSFAVHPAEIDAGCRQILDAIKRLK